MKLPTLLPRNSLPRSTTEDEEMSDPVAPAAEGNTADTSALIEESVRTNLDNHQTLLRLLDEGEKVSVLSSLHRNTK